MNVSIVLVGKSGFKTYLDCDNQYLAKPLKMQDRVLSNSSLSLCFVRQAKYFLTGPLDQLLCSLNGDSRCQLVNADVTIDYMHYSDTLLSIFFPFCSLIISFFKFRYIKECCIETK